MAKDAGRMERCPSARGRRPTNGNIQTLYALLDFGVARLTRAGAAREQVGFTMPAVPRARNRSAY